MKLNKFFFILCSIITFSLAKNVNYATNDIHTLTLPKNRATISLEYSLMNNSMDLFNLRAKELSSNSNFNGIGDLKGYGVKLRYGFTDNLMLNVNFEKFNIGFLNSTLTNERKDIFLRYNFFNIPYAILNSGVSLDVGYVTNALDDVAVDNIGQLNTQKNKIIDEIDIGIDEVNSKITNIQSVKKSFLNNGIDTSQNFTADNFGYLYEENSVKYFENLNGVTKTVEKYSILDFSQLNTYYAILADNSGSTYVNTLTETEYKDVENFIQSVGYINIDELSKDLDDTKEQLLKAKNNLDQAKLKLQNNSDESNYIRLLTGYYNKNSLFNFYIGVKKTNIFSEITLDNINTLKDQYMQLNSMADKYDLTLNADIKNIDDMYKNLNRDEIMYMLGCNYTYESQNFIYEFGLEYDKFNRDTSLNYIDYNYIITLGLNYKLSKNILLYSGTKIMYRQFNGQIPYLYNEYTQTSYDHKYGYTKFGVQYRF